MTKKYRCSGVWGLGSRSEGSGSGSGSESNSDSGSGFWIWIMDTGFWSGWVLVLKFPGLGYGSGSLICNLVWFLGLGSGSGSEFWV